MKMTFLINHSAEIDTRTEKRQKMTDEIGTRQWF